MPGVVRSRVVGRQAELEAVDEFLRVVPDGEAWLVLEAEPGMGTTTLLGAALDEAGRRGFRVLVSRPAPPDAALSFSGLGDLLHPVIEEVGSTLPDPQLRALEVSLLLREAEGEPPGPLAIALGVRGALASLAENGPVVVAVDDAQWLDEPSAAALAHALRRLAAVPVGVVVAGQSSGPHQADSTLLASIPEGARRIRLAPLGPDDLGAMLRDQLGISLPAGGLARLHRASAGNPLAALEIGRAIVESGGDVPSGHALPMPKDVAELLRTRLAGLPPAVRRALLVLSAASEPTAGLVESIEGPAAADALATAIRGGIVEASGPRLRFTHPLFGSVLYADAEAADRRRLHRLLAGAVAEEVNRAMHLALAAEGPDRDLAAEVEAAAEVTHARGAPSAAAELCEQARLLTPAELPDDAYRRTLLEAEYHLDAGELARARALLERLLESPPSEAARGAALERLGWVRYHQDSWTTAAELFREAAAAAEHASGLSAAVELDLAVVAFIGGDLARASSHAGSALERATALDDGALVADASAMVASVDFLLGKGIDEASMERAVEHERWTLPRPTPSRPSVAFGVLLKWSDQLPQSKALLDRALRQANEHGAERSLPFILFHLAEVERWLGDWTAAEGHARLATEVAERTSQEGGRAFALSALALVAAHRGREAEARAAATEGLALASASGAVPASVACETALGFLELSLGRPDRALRHLGPLLEGVASGGIHEPGAMRFLGDALEALVAVGDLEDAGRIIAELQGRSQDLDRAWGSMIAARSLALARAVAGDLAGARASIEAAMGHHERLGQPFELGRTLLVQGTIERRDRRKRSARESLERSLEAFAALGADLWVDRVRAELERIGGRAPSSVALTPTEDRVARLVADGATNQEVAAALFLAVKTVEWNLSRIYRKLGVRSRTELARWVGGT